MVDDDKVFLTVEQAKNMLPDGDTIHVFLNPAGMLLGCDWQREEVVELIEKGQCELGGEACVGMQHGLVVTHEGKHHFIQTNENTLTDAPSDDSSESLCDGSSAKGREPEAKHEVVGDV